MTTTVHLLYLFLAFYPLSEGIRLNCPFPFLNQNAHLGSGKPCATMQLQTNLSCPSVNLSVSENVRLDPAKWHLESLSLKVEKTCSFMVFQQDKESQHFPGGFYSNIDINSIITWKEFLCICPKLHNRYKRAPRPRDFYKKHLVDSPKSPCDTDYWKEKWDDAMNYRKKCANKNTEFHEPETQSFMSGQDFSDISKIFTRDPKYEIKGRDNNLYRSMNKMYIYDVKLENGVPKVCQRCDYVVAGLDNNGKPVHYEAVTKNIAKQFPQENMETERTLKKNYAPKEFKSASMTTIRKVSDMPEIEGCMTEDKDDVTEVKDDVTKVKDIATKFQSGAGKYVVAGGVVAGGVVAGGVVAGGGTTAAGGGVATAGGGVIEGGVAIGSPAGGGATAAGGGATAAGAGVVGGGATAAGGGVAGGGATAAGAGVVGGGATAAGGGVAGGGATAAGAGVVGGGATAAGAGVAGGVMSAAGAGVAGGVMSAAGGVAANGVVTVVREKTTMTTHTTATGEEKIMTTTTPPVGEEITVTTPTTAVREETTVTTPMTAVGEETTLTSSTTAVGEKTTMTAVREETTMTIPTTAVGEETTVTTPTTAVREETIVTSTATVVREETTMSTTMTADRKETIMTTTVTAVEEETPKPAFKSSKGVLIFIEFFLYPLHRFFSYPFF